MPADELGGFFDREQVLGGSPAKRAAALLFLIESRTARLVTQSRQTMKPFLTEGVAQERALAFVEAFSAARELPVQPKIQDLERHAEQWAGIVPRNPRLQAALAHRLGQKYRFTAGVAQGIRQALGLDQAEVQEAYAQLYGRPLEAIYTPSLTARERARWAWTSLAKRLESLPPFWTAYSLTLTETVGASILALPIAVASIGPLAGVVVLVALGLVNVLTVSLIAEAVVRSGPMRYRTAFLGRLVGDYLGGTGSVVLSALLFAFCVLAVPVFYVGFGETLEHLTGLHAAVWIALLFAVGLYYLRRESLAATVATAMVVGAVNVALILAVSLIALFHVSGDNLLHADIPLTGGHGLEGSLVAVVFGVALFAYFGHTAVAICGGLVLRRDPSGSSLVRGCAAAQATAIAVYCLFVLGANGAVSPDMLADEIGTALSPLADETGLAVNVLGSAFVVLALGMGSLYFVLDLFELTRERLPSLAPRIVVLPRRRARLVFEAPRRRLRIGITYLGSRVDGPRFALDREHPDRAERSEVVAPHRWEVIEGDDPGNRLTVEVLEVGEREVRVAVTSTLRMAYEGEWDASGLTLSDVLELSDVDGDLVGWLARSGEATVHDVAARLGAGEEEAQERLRRLVASGAVAESGSGDDAVFSVRLGTRRTRLSEGFAAAIADGKRPPARPSRASSGDGGWRAVLLGRTGRFAVAASPVVAAFAVAEWMVVTGSGSFTGLLSFTGVLVLSILAGLYPVLLLVASRRKGAHAPGKAYRLFEKPALLAAVYLVFLAGLVIHGLVIWDEPVERAGALVAAAAMIALPLLFWRSGALSRRLTIEVRDDQRDGRARYAIVSGGAPAPGHVLLEYPAGEERADASTGEIRDFASLRRAVFSARSGGAPGELKVWAHRVTPEGESESLPARARLTAGADRGEADVSLSRGEALFRVTDADLEVEIALGAGATS